VSALPHNGDPLSVMGAALDHPTPAPVLAEQGERVADRAEDDDGEDNLRPFPPDCPVKPLGMESGLDGTQRCYYLNVLGEIVGLEAGNKHGKNHLVALFGHKSRFLENEWPMWSKPVREQDPNTRQWIVTVPSKVVGFDQAAASRAMIEQCTREGIFNPVGRLRGRGAHALTGGGLLIHVGDEVGTLRVRANGKLTDLEWNETGLHKPYVYPASMPLSRPWPSSVGIKVASDLSKLLQTWNWKRPELDPVLLLGAIGQGFVGGALAWRSNVWITGGAGSGKSSLNGRPQDGLGQGIIAQIFGEALFRTADTSAAAIRQMLKNSTVPVMIDEAESEADNTRIMEVIKLARVASSGDSIHRGGSDHSAREFTMQSPFWFSSINIPPLETSDRSRLAILELRPFKPGTAKPNFGEFNFPDIGRKLFRRMIDAWPWLHEAVGVFHKLLSEAGHSQRACDQFATLLGCAWALLNDEAPAEDEACDWTSLCRPERLAEVSDSLSDEEMCVNQMMTELVQPRGRDSRETVSSLLERWVRAKVAGQTDVLGTERDLYLEQLGLKVVNPRMTESGRWGSEQFMPHAAPGYLAVAYRHKALDQIFAQSRWQGGVWRQTLSRIAGAIDGVKVSFSGHKINAVLVPLHALLDADPLPAASRAEEARAWYETMSQGRRA